MEGKNGREPSSLPFEFVEIRFLTKKTTPYSDFEHIIVLEQNSDESRP